MTCSDAREEMLTAERAVLRGEGVSALAQHLGACAGCRAAALHVDATTGALASMLAGRQPVPRVARQAARWTPRRIVGIAALPVAAAVIAALVLRATTDDTVSPVRNPVAARRRASVSVDVAPGQTATVLRTKDPKVTIVWLAPGGGL